MLNRNIFNNFIKKANHTHQQFFVWFYATNEFAKHQQEWGRQTQEYPGGTGSKYKNFWLVVLPSLQHTWILSATRLFIDPPYAPWDNDKLKPRLSLSYILELLGDETFAQSVRNKIKKYDPTIQSLKKQRDNFLAHNDVSFQPVQTEAGIEDLFEEVDGIITDIKQRQPDLQSCLALDLENTEVLSQCGVNEIFEALLKSGEIVTRQ